jgi:hypothetical protein
LQLAAAAAGSHLCLLSLRPASLPAGREFLSHQELDHVLKGRPVPASAYREMEPVEPSVLGAAAPGCQRVRVAENLEMSLGLVSLVALVVEVAEAGRVVVLRVDSDER